MSGSQDQTAKRKKPNKKSAWWFKGCRVWWTWLESSTHVRPRIFSVPKLNLKVRHGWVISYDLWRVPFHISQHPHKHFINFIMQQIQARNKPKFISEPPFQYLKLWWEQMRMTLSTNLSQFSQLYVGQTTCALQKNFCYSGNLSLLTFYQGTRSGTWVWLVAGATNETTGGWRQSLYHSCFCSIYSSKILYKSKASNKIVIKHAWLAKAVQLCQKHVKKRRSATSQLQDWTNISPQTSHLTMFPETHLIYVFLNHGEWPRGSKG